MSWPQALRLGAERKKGREGEAVSVTYVHECTYLQNFLPFFLSVCFHDSRTTGTCHIFAPCLVSSPPLYLLNHGVFWSDIWTQYSFLQFRKIILMPKWRNRSKNARFLEFSKYVQNCLAQFPLGLNLQQN